MLLVKGVLEFTHEKFWFIIYFIADGSTITKDEMAFTMHDCLNACRFLYILVRY